MKRIITLCLAVVLTLSLAGLAQAILPPNLNSKTLLSFDTMVGVDGIFLGAANPVRDVPGGGQPWVFNAVTGSLKGDGTVTVFVKGLIIPSLGFNPAAFFRVIVSCITLNPAGVPETRNIITPADPTVMLGDPRNGDAFFNTVVDLPNPCLAPVIFITSPTGSWFTVTGGGVIPPIPAAPAVVNQRGR
jgi:hypothetical protein